MQDLKQKLSNVASNLLRNMQGLMPRFNFDWATFADSLEGYLDARFTILKLELKESLNQFAKQLAYGAIIMVLLTLALILLTIGVVQLLNVATGSPYAGMFIVGGVYLVAALGIGYYAQQNIFTKKQSNVGAPSTPDASKTEVGTDTSKPEDAGIPTSQVTNTLDEE